MNEGSHSVLICLCRYDMISKMETLLEDAEVIQRYGFKVKNPAPFPAANIKAHQNSTEKIQKYFRSISREYTAELKKIYKDDFALFGYDSNILWSKYGYVYYTCNKYSLWDTWFVVLCIATMEVTVYMTIKNTWYPSETQRKVCQIFFHVNCRIVSKFCTKQGSFTAMHSTKFIKKKHSKGENNLC